MVRTISSPGLHTHATPPEQRVREWLSAFAAAVRDANYSAGRTMIHDDIVSFGTRAAQVRGAEALVTRQWQHIWSVTRGFAFDVDTADITVTDDTAWAIATWSSQGRDAVGHWFDRYGRSTIILRRDPTSGKWLAVHTHFSLDPRPEKLCESPQGT